MNNGEILKEQGFVIIKNAIPESKLVELRVLQSRIVEYADKNLVDPFKDYYLNHRSDQGVLYDLYQRHPEFQDLVKNDKVLDALEVVLGPNIYLYDNSLIYKPKGRRNEVPWHQDFMSRPDEPLKYIVWMALDNVVKENGALKVIPGSHKEGFLPWYRVKGETHHDRVNKDEVEKRKDQITYLEMEPGDILIFHMLTMHGSDEVSSDLPRRAFRCSYQSMDENIFSPRATPVVVRGGSPEFLAKKFKKNKSLKPKSKFTKGLNLIGYKLNGLGEKLVKYKED